ncbi:MAG TPA: hypothetical protein VGV17_03685 [Bosea sp. (in: a-proteobacteria)]|jgi:hypothetical protein|uniref:hypothetical protein n=1 Tax=Bosea sp. (in: a-proteobacteria) TaxID=1871050 RepID=UPI002DDD7DDE|nr:hypothetical protein [Bosea sp. (in: a-proteobacteria)]HEV2552848.1 hypothetical protein [Bosea sp. (in: a-proteobacteria)]
MIVRFSGPVLGAVAALALAGCQETTTAARPRVDAPGVPVSVQSISGAPDSVTTRFAGLLGEAAAERRMEIVPGDKPARFRVRGYLTAQPTEDGQTALAFVWDVYDESKKRAQRVQGESLGRRGGGSDPWSGIDQTVVAKAAAESMDAIAGFLVTTPAVEAVLPADKAKAAAAKPAGNAAKTAGTATSGRRL